MEQPDSSDRSTSHDLVGRDREVRLLRQLVAEVASGKGSVVTIAGPHGIGKTRLAREAAADAAARALPVLWGRGYDDEGAPVYWPWAELIDALVDNCDSDALLTRMGPDVSEISLVSPRIRRLASGISQPPRSASEGGSDLGSDVGADSSSPVSSSQRYQVFAAVRRLFRSAAACSPYVLILDDLQYFDPASLGLLETLSHEVDGSSLLIISTYVDPPQSSSLPLSHALTELAKLPFHHRMDLTPLSCDDVGELVSRSVDDSLVPSLASLVHERTDGNPLFVVEALRLLQSCEKASSDLAASAWERQLPAAAGVVLATRLASLPESCRRLLAIVALLGRESDVAGVCRAVGIGDEEALDNLAPALQLGLLELVGQNRLRFSHELVRQAIVEGLLPAERQRLHRLCGETLERLLEEGRMVEVARLAHHFSLAGENARIKAIRYLKSAGVAALDAYAYESSLDYFQRARAAGSTSGVELAELKLLEARALVILGRQRRAATLIGEAFETLLSAGCTERAVEALVFPYSWVGQDPNISLGPMRERALTLVPPDSPLSGRLLAYLAANYKFESLEKAIDAVDRSLEIARTHSDPALELMAIQSRSHVHYHHMHKLRHLDDAREGRDLAHRVGASAMEAMLGGVLVAWLLESGDRRGAEEALDRIRPISERMGPDYWTVLYWGARVYLAATRGAWEEMFSLSQQAPIGDFSHYIEFGVATTTTEDRSAWLADYIERCIHRRRSSCDTAAALPHMMLLLARFSHLSDCRTHLGQIREWGREVLARSESCPRDRLRARLALGIEALMRGDRETLDQVFREELVDLQEGYLESHVATDRYRGLFAAALGRTDEARNHYEAALEFCTAADLRPDLGSTCHEYAQLLIANGERSRARALINQGLGIAKELSMVRLNRRLADLDEQLSAPAPDGLTAREMEVLALVAAGRSNKEIGAELFISYHTVVNHLRHMYKKTGAHSRVELANYALRRNVGAGGPATP